MKKLYILPIGILLSCVSYQLTAQNCCEGDILDPEFSEEVRAGIGRIPGWVRDSVSVEEYRILERICPDFNINYEFLNRKMSGQTRSRLFSKLETEYEAIRNDSYVDTLGFGPLYGDIGFIIPHETDLSQKWTVVSCAKMTDGKTFIGKSADFHIYGPSGPGVRVTVWYVYDINDDTAKVLCNDTEPLGETALTGRQADVSANAYYDEEQQMIRVSMAGTLFHVGETDDIRAANFNKAFAFDPEL